MTHYFATAHGRATRESVLIRDLFTCQMCGVALTEGKTQRRSAVVDHIIPVSLWPEGERNQDNMRAVCKRCHDGPCASIEARNSDPKEIARLKLAYRPIGLDGYPIGAGHTGTVPGQ